LLTGLRGIITVKSVRISGTPGEQKGFIFRDEAFFILWQSFFNQLMYRLYAALKPC